MKSRMLVSLLVIALTAAVIGGATMAVFTDDADLGSAAFEAGTVKISADGEDIKVENWNPGDESEIEFCIENVGSKNAYVRSSWDINWQPGPWRILVLWTGSTIQLIGVEWDSFCQGCTGTVGPMATGSATYTYAGDSGGLLNNDYYFRTVFNGLVQEEDWLENAIAYDGWCLDSSVFVTPGTFAVQIFDPICNEDWYTELGLTEGSTLYNRFMNIDFTAINYIFSHNMMARGYNATEIQQAIWKYTNGALNNDGRYSGGLVGGQAIVDYVNGNLVIVEEQKDDYITLLLDDDNWEEINGSYYYTQVLPPGVKACLTGKVQFSLDAGNAFQGMEYRITTWVKAIQASNNAADEIPDWEWSPGVAIINN